MDEFPDDDGLFIFNYPLWVCFQMGPPVVVLQTSVRSGGRGFTVFTDKDTAKEFLEIAGGLLGLKIGSVGSREDFAKLLLVLVDADLTHIIFDDGRRGTGLKRSIAIKSLLEKLINNTQPTSEIKSLPLKENRAA